MSFKKMAFFLFPTISGIKVIVFHLYIINLLESKLIYDLNYLINYSM